MKTAILIHGCHLQAKNWENIIWGAPSVGVMGRVSKGLAIAIRERPSLICWGTGASEKKGMTEGRYTFRYAVDHAQELAYFKRCSKEIIDQALRRISFVDVKSQNTKEEVSLCMNLCLEQDIKRLILVSSPDHIGRCHQYAMDLRSSRADFKNLCISSEGSDTRFANSEPGGVLIVEPPHRGDRAEIPLHKTLKLAMFARKLDREKASKFNGELI